MAIKDNLNSSQQKAGGYSTHARCFAAVQAHSEDLREIPANIHSLNYNRYAATLRDDIIIVPPSREA